MRPCWTSGKEGREGREGGRKEEGLKKGGKTGGPSGELESEKRHNQSTGN